MSFQSQPIVISPHSVDQAQGLGGCVCITSRPPQGRLTSHLLVALSLAAVV